MSGLTIAGGLWNTTALTTGAGLPFGQGLLAGGQTAAQKLLGSLGDLFGLAIDFATDQSMVISDQSTPSNDYTSAGTVLNGSLTGPGGNLTYSAPSPKLTLQSNGYYRYQAHNLLLQSETLTTSWTTSNSTVVGSGAYQSSTTYLLTTSASGGYVQQGSVKSTAGQTLYGAVIAFQGNAAYFDMYFVNQTQFGAEVRYTFSGGSTSVISGGGGITPSMTNLGGGFWLCSFTTTPTANSSSDVFRIIGVNNGDTVLLTRAMLCRQPCANMYIKTTTTALYSLPYEWNTSGVCQGVLCEPQATNLALTSTKFATTFNPFSNITLTDTNTTSPTGVANSATTCVALLATGSGDCAMRDSAGEQAINTTYTLSVYAKYVSCQYLKFRNIALTSATDTAWFDIKNGLVGTVQASITSAQITSVGNGWYRCSITGTTPASITNNFVDIGMTDTDNSLHHTLGQQFNIWQYQIEATAYATSPIITGSATVTRAADYISLATSSFPSISANLTCYLSAALAQPLVVHQDVVGLLPISVGSYLIWDTNTLGWYAASLSPSGYNSAANAVNKGAMACDAVGNISACFNNSTVSTSASCDWTGSSTTLALGSRGAGDRTFVGYIRQVLILPRRATNAQIQTLTT